MIQINLLTKKKNSQTQKMNLWLLEMGAGTDSQRVWDGHVHTDVFQMENQQGLIVQHMELCSMLCGSLDGSWVWRRMDTCICMAQSLGCSPEIITSLLIGCTPVQSKKCKKKYRKISAISATIWKPHNTPPNYPWVKEKIERDNRKYFG